MNKKEINEIKKNFSDDCGFFTVNHVVTAFVDAEKNIKCKTNQLYNTIPQDEAWKDFSGVPQELQLPSAPKQFLNYFTEDDRPQAKLDRNLEGGMAVSIGRLREDSQYDYKFVCLSHNTLRGAAGGAVLLAELLAAKGYFD